MSEPIDIKSLPPAEVYRLARELRDVPVIGPWTNKNSGNFERFDSQGVSCGFVYLSAKTEAMYCAYVPPKLPRLRGMINGYFCSIESAQAAVDSILLASGAIVVEPVVVVR